MKDTSLPVQPFDMSDQLNERLAQLGHEHCIFARQGYSFAISVAAAREVLIGESPTRVPQAPLALVGVLNLRGEVLPLVKLDMLLDLAPRPYVQDDQVLVLSCDGTEVGLIVDRVREVRAINPKDMIRVPDSLPRHRLFKGYWEGPNGGVILLDADGLVTAAVAVVANGFRDQRAAQSSA